MTLITSWEMSNNKILYNVDNTMTNIINMTYVGADDITGKFINTTFYENRNVSTLTDAMSWSEGYSLVYYICVAILLQASVIVNSLVILIVCCTPKLRTTPNVFISSLAVSELIFAIFITTRSVIASNGLITGQWPDSGPFLGNIMIFIWLYTLCSNYTNILLISLERWFYITKPFLHQKLNRTILVLVCLVLAWTIPLVINVEVITESNLNQHLRLRFAYLFPAFHVIWCTALAVIYVHICVITRRQIKIICKMTIPASRREERGAPNSFKDVRANWKTFKLLVVVFGTFFVLNTPGILYNIHLVLNGSGNFFSDVPWYFKLFTVLHNCSNFFIYVHQDKTFYHVLCKSLRSRIRSRPAAHRPENIPGYYLTVVNTVSSLSRAQPLPFI